VHVCGMKLGTLRGGTRQVLINCYQLQLLKQSALKATSFTCMHDLAAPVASLPPPPLTLGPARQRALAVWALTAETTFPCLHYKKHKTITWYECIHIWDTLSNSWPPSRSLGM